MLEIQWKLISWSKWISTSWGQLVSPAAGALHYCCKLYPRTICFKKIGKTLEKDLEGCESKQTSTTCWLALKLAASKLQPEKDLTALYNFWDSRVDLQSKYGHNIRFKLENVKHFEEPIWNTIDKTYMIFGRFCSAILLGVPCVGSQWKSVLLFWKQLKVLKIQDKEYFSSLLLRV